MLLNAPAEILVERLKKRANNPYGKDSAETRRDTRRPADQHTLVLLRQRGLVKQETDACQFSLHLDNLVRAHRSSNGQLWLLLVSVTPVIN